MGDEADSIRVVVRVRPFTARETARDCKCCVEMEESVVYLIPPDKDRDFKAPHEGKRDFKFDRCFWSHDRSDSHFATQDIVFDDVGITTLNNAFSGYNVCVFAYGQTGAGKSYSMVGSPDDKGIVPRIAINLFEYIDKEREEKKNVSFDVVTSMIEIYSEKIRDLLSKNPTGGKASGMKVREDPKIGPYVEGLTAMPAHSYKEIERLLAMGNNARSVASTHMNDVSSRAHTIFSIKFTQTIIEELGDGTARETKKVSKINLVDLAGSERQSNKQLSASEQARFKEGIAINKSLSALSNCIFALFKQSQETAGSKKTHVPYRDSQLTWLLKESLGGNAKTVMLAAISPADINYEESLSTLQYAARAKRIKTNAVVNEDINNKIIRELRAEIEALRRQVAGQGPADADAEVQELRRQLLESQKMIEEMNSTFQEKLSDAEKAKKEEKVAKVDPKCPQLVNLSEDPMMTECLVYYITPGAWMLGSEVDEEGEEEGTRGIPLVGQSIAPVHCKITAGDGQVMIESVEGALTFVNGRKITEPTVLKQGNRIVIGTSHIFRFHDPVEAARLRKEREEYMAAHPNEAVSTPSVIDWNYATQELRAMNFQEDNVPQHSLASTPEPSTCTTPNAASDRDLDEGSPLSSSKGSVSRERLSSVPDAVSSDRHSSERSDMLSAATTRLAASQGGGGGAGGKHKPLADEDEENNIMSDDDEETEDEDEEDDDGMDLSALDALEVTDTHSQEGDNTKPEDPPPDNKPVLAGIGVLVQRLGGHVTVVDLVAGGPAALSGKLRIGQVVLEVDGNLVETISFTKVLHLIRGPVGSFIQLMVQDPLEQGQAQIVKLQRGLLPAKPTRPDPTSTEEEDEEEDSSEESDEAEALDEDESFVDLSEMGGGGDGLNRTPSIKSEVVGSAGKKGRRSSLTSSLMSPEKRTLDKPPAEDSSSGDESEEGDSDGSDMLNLEEVAAGSLEDLEESTDDDGDDSLEALEELSEQGGAGGQQPAHQQEGAQQQRQHGQQKSAPLCIKIDVEPTNKQAAGYSLMFNVETVAQGLRYGVTVRDHKTMLKVYPRCFCGPEALEWLTQHALKAFMNKEKVDMGQPVGERLHILSRSAALLLAQRLIETEVFSQVNKTKARNPFSDPSALFRFREDEKAGPVLNTRHAWNCRARPPVLVAADLLQKGILLHLRPSFPNETSQEYQDFMQVAEELQMVDTSVLFRKAETSFFLNLHNALLLHTHYHRKTGCGENLKQLRNKLPKLHQYRIGGQCYCMEDMRHRLLRHKPGARCADPRIHFALSLGSMSCPDVRVYGVDELDEQLNEVAFKFCERHVRIDVSSDRSSSITTTLLLPKVFKWHGKAFGFERKQMLQSVAQYVEDPIIKALLEEGTCRIKYPDYDWRKRPAGAPP